MATSTSDLPLAGLTQFRLLTSDEARQALLDEIDERRDDLSDGTVETTTSVSDAVEVDFANRMVDARAGIGRANPRSIKIYRSTAKNWITPYLGDLAVCELTSGRLDRYFRRDVPPSRYTDTRKVLNAFVRWLIIQGVLQADPALNLLNYQRQTPRKRGRLQRRVGWVWSKLRVRGRQPLRLPAHRGTPSVPQ